MFAIPKSVTIEGRRYELINQSNGQIRLNGGKRRKYIYVPMGTTFDGHDDFRAKCIRVVKDWEVSTKEADENFQQYLKDNNVLGYRRPVTTGGPGLGR